MDGHGRAGATGRRARRVASLVAAAMLGGCGGVSLGPDPEAPNRASPADRADAPEPGSEDWPDETVPLVTVDLERPAPAVTEDAGTARPAPSEP